MSHVRLPATAANFTFGGAFTRDPPTAANLTFTGIPSTTGVATGLDAGPTFGTPQAVQPQVGVATGLNAGATFGTPDAIQTTVTYASGLDASPTFGTPQAVAAQVEQASGLDAAPTFGAPIALVAGAQAGDADGFLTTAFGTPVGVATDPLAAVGLNAAPNFGTPTAASRNRAATLGVVTKFGYVYFPFTQTPTATGKVMTQCGKPIAFRYLPRNPTRFARATRIAPKTRFGNPTLGG